MSDKHILILKSVLMLCLLGVVVCLSGCTGSDKSLDTPEVNSPNDNRPIATISTGSQESISAKIIEPEELISKEEAEQLLGEAVREGEKGEQALVGQKICFYDADNENSPYFFQIAITQAAFMKNESQTPESIYTMLKEELDETSEQKQIGGIGGEYFFGMPGLHILKDGYYLCIAAGNSDNEKVRQVLEKAGSLVVENLEKILSR